MADEKKEKAARLKKWADEGNQLAKDGVIKLADSEGGVLVSDAPAAAGEGGVLVSDLFRDGVLVSD